MLIVKKMANLGPSVVSDVAENVGREKNRGKFLMQSPVFTSILLRHCDLTIPYAAQPLRRELDEHIDSLLPRLRCVMIGMGDGEILAHVNEKLSIRFKSIRNSLWYKNVLETSPENVVVMKTEGFMPTNPQTNPYLFINGVNALYASESLLRCTGTDEGKRARRIHKYKNMMARPILKYGTQKKFVPWYRRKIVSRKIKQGLIVPQDAVSDNPMDKFIRSVYMDTTRARK